MVATTGGPQLVLAVVVVYVVVQLLESNAVVPIVMRNSVGLSPFLVLVSLLIGATLGGILGAFVAVPIAASVEIVLERLQARDVPVALEPDVGEEEPLGAEAAAGAEDVKRGGGRAATSDPLRRPDGRTFEWFASAGELAPSAGAGLDQDADGEAAGDSAGAEAGADAGASVGSGATDGVGVEAGLQATAAAAMAMTKMIRFMDVPSFGCSARQSQTAGMPWSPDGRYRPDTELRPRLAAVLQREGAFRRHERRCDIAETTERGRRDSVTSTPHAGLGGPRRRALGSRRPFRSDGYRDDDDQEAARRPRPPLRFGSERRGAGAGAGPPSPRQRSPAPVDRCPG